MKPRAGVFLLVLVVLGALPGCGATGPHDVAQGNRVVVRLYDADGDFELALANETHPELQGVYSRERNDGSLKLAEDQLVSDLLASLSRGGFDRYAIEGASPPAGRGFMAVEREGVPRVFVQPGRNAPSAERQAFANLKLIMDYYYSHIGALQYVENEGGFEFRKPE